MTGNTVMQQAIEIAMNASVDVDADRAVFFSGQKNRREAMRFCREHQDEGFSTLLNTDAHRELAEIPIFGKNSPFSVEEAVDLTAIASARYAQGVEGEVQVFSHKVSERSIFYTIELPALLLNEKVDFINGEDKMTWLDLVQPPILPRTDIITPEFLHFDVSDLRHMGHGGRAPNDGPVDTGLDIM